MRQWLFKVRGSTGIASSVGLPAADERPEIAMQRYAPGSPFDLRAASAFHCGSSGAMRNIQERCLQCAISVEAVFAKPDGQSFGQNGCVRTAKEEA